MECSWPETLATTLKMVVEEVKEGREFANQLRSVLEMSGGSGSARDLVIKILKSFSNTLFLLNVKEEGVDQASVISPVQADSGEDLRCSDACKAEDSLEGCRINSTNSTPTKKNRRGCYDRRLRKSLIWMRETQTPINDGQAWRKYGQKVILNAKYLRHYFRCTYRYDQGCKATKQVQRIQVNPPLYRTTYFGHHTCKDLHINPELILDCIANPSSNSKFISFDNTDLTNKQEHPFFSSTPKQQLAKDEKTCDDVNHSQHSLSTTLLSKDYFVSPDVVESPRPRTMLSTQQESSDHGDAIYGMIEYVDCFDIHDLFQSV